MINSLLLLLFSIFLAAIIKVGSCPNDENSVQIFFLSFLCCIGIILCAESVAAKKNARFAENSWFFVYLFIFCWNSDSKNSFATCP